MLIAIKRFKLLRRIYSLFHATFSHRGYLPTFFNGDNCRAALAQPCLGGRPPRRMRGKKRHPRSHTKTNTARHANQIKPKPQAIYLRFQTLTSLLIPYQIIVIYKMTTRNRFCMLPTHSIVMFYWPCLYFINYPPVARGIKGSSTMFVLTIKRGLDIPIQF